MRSCQLAFSRLNNRLTFRQGNSVQCHLSGYWAGHNRARQSPYQCHRRQRQRSFASASKAVKKNGVKSPLTPQNNGGKDIEPWLESLEKILPPEVRRSSATSPESEALSNLQPVHIATLLSEARRLGGHDLLLALAQRHRWRELVWLVTYLIDNLWHGNPVNTWRPPSSPLASFPSLDKFVADRPELTAIAVGQRTSNFRRLDQALSDDHPLSRTSMREQSIGHQLLGEIWHSLGSMILEDKRLGQSIQPGILEIIALLHSRNIMPDAIYRFSPQQSGTAGSQPPTLHLLSSQIMTSLSDAVWQARQASAVEDAHRRGRPAVFMGPELPSSDYRVRVAGVRHEIWLELVLWACLHGGWLKSGAAVLDEVITQKESSWSALSWREMIEPLIKVGQEQAIDWDHINSNFAAVTDTDTNNKKSNDGTGIENTISSDVVSAYVDGLMNDVSVGVGWRGMPPGYVVGLLSHAKTFLRKSDFSLEATSWDAVIQRFLESECLNVEGAPSLTERLLSLSSTYDEERSRGAPTRDEAWRPLAPYLIDGSAISLGITHRVLKTYIGRGNVAAAFYAFQNLQLRTDANKRQRIAAFFKEIGKKSREEEQEEDSTVINFESPYSQAFPAFYTMLPTDVLAPFLDLITEIGAMDFGKWLLASQDVDGPVVRPSNFLDPVMAPAIIRFLAASGDETLLAQILQRLQMDSQNGVLPTSVFIAVLESQFQLGNSSAAITLMLDLLRNDNHVTEVSETLLAILAREALKSQNKSSASFILFKSALEGKTNSPRAIRQSIAAVLMVSDDDEMKKMCSTSVSLTNRIDFQLSVKSFNTILEGVVSARGSASAKSLVCRFSELAKNVLSDGARFTELELEMGTGLKRVIGRVRPGSVVVSNKDDVSFYITSDPDLYASTQANAQLPPRGEAGLAGQPAEIHVSGRFMPDLSTIRIILNERVKELRNTQPEASVPTSSPIIGFNDTMIKWCAAMLQALGMRPRDVEGEIEGIHRHASIEEEGEQSDGDHPGALDSAAGSTGTES